MDNLPDVLRIEPTGLCNFQCQYCPTGISANGRGMLFWSDFLKVMSQIDEVPRVVVLYHGGEPLLNKAVPDMVKYCKEIGVCKTVINSNASALTEKIAIELIDAGLDEIRFSFDGNSPKENDMMRQGGYFPRDSANVMKMLDMGGGTNVVIANVCILDEDMIYPGDYDISVPKYLLNVFGDRVTYRAYAARRWPGLNENGYKVVKYPKEPTYCPLLFETITILSNGNVVPCCEDIVGQAVMGNIFSDKLADIWDGEIYSNFRDDFKRRNYPQICQRCSEVEGSYLVRPS